LEVIMTNEKQEEIFTDSFCEGVEYGELERIALQTKLDKAVEALEVIKKEANKADLSCNDVVYLTAQQALKEIGE